MGNGLLAMALSCPIDNIYHLQSHTMTFRFWHKVNVVGDLGTNSCYHTCKGGGGGGGQWWIEAAYRFPGDAQMVIFTKYTNSSWLTLFISHFTSQFSICIIVQLRINETQWVFISTFPLRIIVGWHDWRLSWVELFAFLHDMFGTKVFFFFSEWKLCILV